MLIQSVRRSETVQDKPKVGRPNCRLVQTQFLVQTWSRQQVARQVFPDQLVIGNIRIQGSNQVVPVSVGIGNIGVALTAMRVRIPDPIHPVTCPTLAKLRRFQQFAYQLFDRRLRIIGVTLAKGILLFLGGRQAYDCKVKTPEQSEGIRNLVWLKFGSFHTFEKKFIHWMSGPFIVHDLRRQGFPYRLETPPFLSAFPNGFP